MHFTTRDQLMDFLPIAQALLFDLDGTLVELNVDWQGIREFIKRDYKEKYGSPIKEGRFMRMFALIEEQQGKAVADVYRMHNKAKELEAVNLGYPTVKPLLATGLTKLAKLTPATAIYGVISSNFHETIDNLFATMELPVEFEYIIARDDVKIVKPNPEGLLRIIKLEKLDPDKVLYCGDLHTDLEAAENSRVPFIYAKDLQLMLE